MKSVILVIPPEGGCGTSEIWYINELKVRYRKSEKQQAEIVVYEHKAPRMDDRFLSLYFDVCDFVNGHNDERFEIHAQGGLGARVAYELLHHCPERVDNVFLIGGAPSNAMTKTAYWFYQGFARLWYRMRWLEKFAFGPNSEDGETLKKIKAVSAENVRANPDLYLNQLLLIGEWGLSPEWQASPENKVYFVPVEGKIYDNEAAESIWAQHGVLTWKPEKSISCSMSPSYELFCFINSLRRRKTSGT